MKPSDSCPECGNDLSNKAKRCSCGWRKPEPQVSKRDHHRCTYIVAEMRCPLPGTMSPHPYGTENWYCRRHYHTLDNPRHAEAELRYINENYQKILNEEYTDWRRDLFKPELLKNKS